MARWTSGRKKKKPENLSSSGFVVAGLGRKLKYLS